MIALTEPAHYSVICHASREVLKMSATGNIMEADKPEQGARANSGGQGNSSTS
jgi:hypothetical protein